MLSLALILTGCVEERVVSIGEEPRVPSTKSGADITVIQEKDGPTGDIPAINLPIAGSQTKSQPEHEAIELSEEEKDIQKLKQKAADLKSFKYGYRDPRYTDMVYPYAANFFVKGNKIKAVLLTPDEEVSARLANFGESDTVVYRKQLYQEDYFDNLFFDTYAQTAIGACLSRLCHEPGKIIRLKYSNYIRKTPLDWTNQIPLPGAKIIERKMIENRQITKVEFTDSGKLVILWIDEYSGLPLRVESPEDTSKGDLNTLRFENLAVNAVKDSDVVLP